MALDDFLSELETGDYRDQRSELIEQYRRHAEQATSPKFAALVAIEFADRLSMLTLKQYNDWLTKGKKDQQQTDTP